MKNPFKTTIYLIITILISNVLLVGCNISNINKSKPSISPSPPTSVSVTPTPVPVVIPTPTAIPVVTPTIPVSSPQPTLQPSVSAVSGGPDSIQLTAAAEEMLKQMTLEEKVGQMFFVRCRKDQALQDILSYKPGGYILFSEDFKDRTKDDVIKVIKSYQDSAQVPMLIGVDEEGGKVNRVSRFTQFRSVPFKSPQDLYSLGGFELVTGDTIEKAKLLKSLGINVNLAPVCDVSTDPMDFIYSRSFGMDAEKTAEYVQTVVTAMNSLSIGCTLKHFPGYGNNVDTHTGIATDNRSYDTFVKSDFLPFKAGIEAGAGSILVSHNIVTSMDKDYPASLSAKVHEILRKDLSFNGVIMTDDLSMEAITKYTGNQKAAVLAVTAGNDLLIATDFDVQIPAVIAAVKDGTISEDQIDEAVLHVLIWKLTLGIIK